MPDKGPRCAIVSGQYHSMLLTVPQLLPSIAHIGLHGNHGVFNLGSVGRLCFAHYDSTVAQEQRPTWGGGEEISPKGGFVCLKPHFNRT